MNLKHLRGRKTAENVLRRGTLWKGRTMLIRVLQGPPRIGGKPDKPGVYLGTFASAKLSKSAVVRNRMRRRCREALRLAIDDATNLPSMQLLVTPRIASLKTPFQDIEEDVRHFLTTL